MSKKHKIILKKIIENETIIRAKLLQKLQNTKFK